MSQIFPKKKEKRPRSSSNEINTSFVKNVTSRVSSLLPSSITKWFSSPSSSNANGSAQVADASDSSSDDEASETPVIVQPPAKRMRFSSPSNYNHYGSAEASCSTSNADIIEMPYSYSGQQYAQPGRSNYTTPLRPPNEDQEMTERDTPHMFKLPHTVSSIGQSIANKRKSIFESTGNVESSKVVAKTSTNTVSDLKQPSFKSSLLGSPFYPGRTMYGGASSSYINQPYIKQHTVAVVNESNMKNDDTAISSSARRVLDLLESYSSSSPLMEARRIPSYTKPKNESFNTSLDSAPYNHKHLSYKNKELYVPSIASILQLKKKSRLMDTTSAARQIIASHSSTSNYPAYPIVPKGKEPEQEQPSKMTTKVKSRLTRVNRGKQEELDVATPVELPTAVLQIDQNKLPKFTFDTPVSKNFPATSTPKTIFSTGDKNIVKESASKRETVTGSVFKFSNPVTVSSDHPQMDSKKFLFEKPEIDTTFDKRDVDSVDVGTVKVPEITIKSKEWQCSDCWVKNKPEDNKCVCCGSKQPSQKAKCSVCKLADSQSQKDKCANCEKSVLLPVTTPFKATSTAVSQSKWKCEDCWVSNDDGAGKCACCGGKRPKKVKVSEFSAKPATSNWNTNTATTQSGITSETTAPKKVETDWKCDDCWISNKISVDKCAACGGARPGTKQSATVDVPANTTSLYGTSDNTFKTIIKSQKSDKWECTSCLVRNESCKEKCACCGAEREGTKKINDAKFNFDTTANTSFKFGIDPNVQMASIAKPQVISTIESIKPIPESETNNNVLAETPTFTFTIPAKKGLPVESKASDQAPKMNFTFGIPKQIPALSTKKDLESNKIIEEEKLQEVPSVDLNSPIQEKPKPLEKIPMFSAPNESNENTALTSSRNLFNPLASDAKKDTPSNPITLLTESKTEKPTPTFSFGVKPNSTVFDTTPKTSTSVNMFAQPIQTTPLPTSALPTTALPTPALPTTALPTTALPTTALPTTALPTTAPPTAALPTASLPTPGLPTTSAPLSLPVTTSTSTSLFKQPDLTPKPVSLFQNSETTNNPATGTMFSFGNNGISNTTLPPVLATPSAPEQPKFQFTFGSTAPKTETQTMFKPTFGTIESNTSSFSLPTAPTLGSGNVLPTNTLGGSNGLSASNGLTGNVLPGNTLGSNPLTILPIGNATSMNSSLGGSNGLTSNSLTVGNNLQTENLMTGSATGLFNNAAPKDVWPASNNAATPSLFGSNNATSSVQKPAPFTFGSTTPFNQPNNTPAFGNPTQNIFGMGNQNTNTQPSIFASPAQNAPTGNLFGSPQPASNPTPQMSMFGAPSIAPTPAFGSQNTSIPTFETPSLPPAPTFNFGATQSTGIFGFGQQQQQQQQQQLQQPHLQLPQSTPPTGVYNFGGAPAGAPQVQFTMGSNPAGRRVRKAVRRNPPR